MAVERCPECGRAWDGAMCLACGHEAGASPAAASSNTTTTAAPPQPSPPAEAADSPMNSLPATQNPFATGATATGAVNPFASAGATNNPLTAAPGSPRPVTGLYTGPTTGRPPTSAPLPQTQKPQQPLAPVPKTPPTPAPRTETFARPDPRTPATKAPSPPSSGEPPVLARPQRPPQPHVAVKKPKSSPPAPKAPGAAERCPDCGRMIVAGACLACGWRDERVVDEKPAFAAPAKTGGSDMGATSDLANNYPARDDLGGEAPPADAFDAEAAAPTPQPFQIDATLGDARPASDVKTPISPEKKRLGMIAAFAGTFIVALIIALVLLPAAGSVDDMTHQDAVDARATLAALKSVANDRRTGEQWLDVAHAHASLGESESALSAYTSASKLSTMDEAGTRYCIAQLADPLMRDIAVRVLTDFPQGTNVDALLKEVLDHDALVMRNNALRVLKRRGTDTVDMHVDVAIADLTRGPTCSDRRNGLKRLGDYASGTAKRRTLDAIRTVEDHIGTELNSCMIVEIDKIKARIIDR